MDINRRQQSTVLFGDKLNDAYALPPDSEAECFLEGEEQNKCAVQIPINNSILSRHMLFLGGIGTGKTNALFQIISQLSEKLTSNDVMIIFDTKGDFYREFYRPGDVVFSNDITSIASGELNYWNIFNEVDRGDYFNESIVEISKAIFAQACEKTNQIFFPNAAKDIFMACIHHFFRSFSPSQQTNANLVKYIQSAQAADLRAMLNSYEDFRALSSYISEDSSPQTQGVLSELQQVVREVFVGNFAKAGTLSLRNLVREKGGNKIFIEYDLSIGNMLSPVYSLMFDMAIKEALGRKRSDGNVYFVCDEFKLLPYLSHIDDAVNFGRSLGIKFMVGIQNVEQIYENYGEERARSIMSGFMTSINFRVNDAKSREYIQGLFGKNQKLESFVPVTQSKGIVETQREAYVVEDWDITRLKTGEAIIGLPENNPFFFKFNKY